MNVIDKTKPVAENNEDTVLQSKTIDFLRFPLVVMVVFIHINPNVVNLPDADFSFWSWHGLYNFIGILFSHTLSTIAVPTFFFISGFLFFINIQDWSWSKYQTKIKNRIKTLIIPYTIWNLASFVLTLLAWTLFACIGYAAIDEVVSLIKEYNWHIFYDCRVWDETKVNWIGQSVKMTGPYDLPLWFLRDLIVVTIFAPLIFQALKRLKIFFIIVLFLAYISRIWILIPGFNISAWFFFSTGAYFAINKYNIIHRVRKYAFLFIPVFLILLPVVVIYDGSNTTVGENIIPFFVCSGVPAIIYLASVCISKFKFQPNKFLVSSCFFIYAFHGVTLPYLRSPIGFTAKVTGSILQKITGGEMLSFAGQLITYFITPFVTILISLLVLMIARRLFPRGVMLFTGNK